MQQQQNFEAHIYAREHRELLVAERSPGTMAHQDLDGGAGSIPEGTGDAILVPARADWQSASPAMELTFS